MLILKEDENKESSDIITGLKSQLSIKVEEDSKLLTQSMKVIAEQGEQINLLKAKVASLEAELKLSKLSVPAPTPTINASFEKEEENESVLSLSQQDPRLMKHSLLSAKYKQLLAKEVERQHFLLHKIRKGS